MAFKAVLLLACTAGALAGPLNYQYSSEGSSTECARTCPDTGKFEYVPGNTYEYQYEADFKTHIPGTTEEHSSLHLRANVQIEAITKCEMALRMSGVTLQDSDPSDYNRRQPLDGAAEWARALQERPLRFAYLDGTVDLICPDERESTWVLNVKRGLLSSLQNTMVTLEGETGRRETDVSGECDVEYKVSGQTWSTKKITKSKDMLSCAGHQHLHSIIQSTPYRVSSKLQSLPLLKSTQECTQEINSDKIVSSSVCKEMHTFRPFSRGSSGATTDVEQKLTFSRMSRGTNTRQGTISSRKSLTFEHVENVEELETSRRDAQNTLRELCRETSQDVRPTTPALFSQLVKHLKKLDANTLITIHRGSSGICAKAHEFVHDALPTLGTTSAVRVMKDLVLSGEADQMETDIWFTSMSFIANPTREMLTDVKPVLTSDRANRKAVLAISALVHSYCRFHDDCGEHQEVRDIVSVFEDNLRYNCKTTTDDLHDKVMMSLKAIGNTGNAESIAPTLTRCFQTVENPMHVRIAAVQAFRRMACHATSDLLDLLRNADLDSELRINAYLTLMECPTQSVFMDVKRLLEDEEVNQVGSFIWTHLTNLMETSSPLKQETREILEQITLEKKFDLDQRKFSRNIELSGFSTMLNAGAAVESNVIFSSKSWIPRSASMDLTIDMFGQSINLVEVGGRVEGADKVIERMFANKEVNDVLSRQKRDLISPGTFDSFSDFKPGHEDDPKLSYFLRVFGNEIRFDDFHGFDMDSVKEKFNYLQWLIELAKEHEIDATKSIQFLDSSLVVPTIVGLPLKLSVDGTAVMDVKVRGKLDLRNIGAAPRSLDIDGSVRPSAAVEITGEMGVDAWIAKTGLKLVNTLHTSNVLDGKIQLQDGQVFVTDVNIPSDRIELFDYRSQFFVVHRENDREQQMISEGRTEKDYCIGGKLEDALGIKLCGEIAFPSLRPKDGQPWFPFNGPVTGKMFLQKEDTHTGYHMEAKLIPGRRAQDSDELKISFNTPGSQVDRELTLDYMLNRKATTVTLGLKSPWKKADFTGAFVNEHNKKKVTARAMIDDKKEYSFTSELAIQKSKINTRYTPLVEVSIPGQRPYRLTGNVLYRSGKKMDVDLSVVNVFSDTITLTGDVTYIKKRSRWQSNLAVKSPVVIGSVDGYVEKGAKNDLVSSRLELEYTLDPQQRRATQERFTVSNKWRWSNKANAQYSLDTAITSTKWPQWNMDGKFEVAKSKNQWQSTIDAGLTDTNKRIKWTQSLINNSNQNKIDFDVTARFRFPFKKLDYQMSIDHQHTLQMVKHSSTVKYAANKEAVFNIDAAIESQSPLKAKIESSLTYPGRTFAFKETLEEKKSKEYHHTMDIKLDAYDDIMIKSIYKMQPRHEISADIMIPNLRPIKVEGFLNPDLKNFQGHAETSYGSDSYALDTNWFYNGRPIAFASRGGVEVSYPGRRIKTEGEFSRRQSTLKGSLGVQWDVNRDPGKKVAVNGEVNIDSTLPSFQVKTQWYPNRFIDLSGTFKNDKKGWFSVTRDLEGTLKAVTSFRGYENVDFMFRHDQAKDECKTHSEVSWGRNQKIEYDFDLKKPNDWNDLQVMWSVTTPFDAYRIGKWELNYSFRPGTLRADSKFDYNGQVTAINLNGRTDLRTHMVDGSVTVNTPFRGYETMMASLKHNDNGKVFNSEMKTRLNAEWNFVLTMKMDHMMQGYFITNNGEVAFTCPRGTQKIIWDHKNDKDNIASSMEFDQIGKKYGFDVEANHKKTYKKRSVDFKAKLHCHYAEDILINFNHQHDRKNYKNIRTSGNVQWKDNKNIAFENDMSYVPNKYTTKNLKITTPFRGYEKMSSTVNTRINGDEITSHKEVKWGNNNKITSDATLKMMGTYEFEYSWRVTTPFDMVQRASAKLSNMNVNGVWKTDAEGQLNRDKAEISTQVGLRSPRKLMIDVKTPSEYMRNMLVDLEFKGMPRDFTSKATINHNMLDEAIEANLKVDTSELDDIKAEFSLDTPFRPAKSVKSMFSHKLQRDTYKTDASIQVPRYKGTFSNELSFVNGGNWNTKTEVEYMPGKKIKVNTEFAMNRKEATGEFSFESPFPGAEMYKLTFIQRGNLINNFENNAELMYAPSKTIATSVMYKNMRDSIEASAEITTPFRELRKGAIALSHSGDLIGQSKQTFSAEYNGKRISGSHDMSFDGRNNYQCTTNVQTPFRGFRALELRVKHEGEITDFKNDVSFSYDQNRISNHLEFEYDRTGAKGKIEFSSPFEILRDFKFEIDHSGSMKDFRNSGTVQYNGQRYSGNTQYRNNRRGYSAVAGVSLPEEYGISVNHKGDYYDMVNNMELNLDGKKTTAETIYKNDGRNVESSINLRSPYRGYEQAKASMNHKNTGSGFVTIADLESPFRGYDKFNFQVNHDGSSGVKTTGTVRTPFEILPVANFEVSHTGDRDDFSSTGAVEINKKRYSGNVNYKNERNGMEGGFGVQTPHRNYENQGFSFTHRNTRQGIKTSANIDTSMPGYKNFGTEMAHKGDWQNFESSLKLDTPFEKMPVSAMSISHSGDPKDFTTTVKVDYNGQPVEGTVTLKKIGGWFETDHEAMIKLSSPFEQLRDFEMKTEHKDQGRQCMGSIEVTHNGEKKIDADYTKKGGNRKSIELNVRSPRPVTATASIDTSGEINGDASVNWDPRSRNKNVRFEYGLKNQVGDRRVNFKTILPNRIVGIDTGYRKTDGSFAHDMEFQWDKDAGSKISYNVEGTLNKRRRQDMFDGKLDIKTPYGPMEMTVTNNHMPNRCVTEVGIKGSEKLTLKHELVMNKANWEDFSMTTTLMHPRMKRDAVLKIEGVMQPQPLKWDGNVNLQYSTQNFAFNGKIADESAGRNAKYVAEAKMTHPNSFTDIDFKSELVNNRENVGGNMELKYQSTKDKQIKTMGLRAEINKLREELNFEMTNPMNKNIRLTGRQVMRDFENGMHKFSVSGNVAGNDVSGELEVDTSSPGAEVKLNYSPDDMVHMYGRYLTPSHMQMEVNHESRGQKTQDAHFSLRLGTDGMLGTRAFLRKEIKDDLKNMFSRNQRMSRQFGELSNDINEEMGMKMRYMGRAAQPLQEAMDYTTNSISNRIDPVANDFNQAYRRNEFYMKDACEAAQGVYEDMSERMNYHMNELRQRYGRQWEQMKREWSQKYQSMGYDMEQAMQNYYQWKEQASRDMAENFDNMMEQIRSCYNDRKQQMYRAAQSYSPSGLIQKYEDLAEYVVEKYNRFMNTDFAKKVMNHIDQCKERMSRAFENFKDNNQWLVESYWNAYYRVSDQYKKLMSYPEAQQVKAFVIEMVKTSKYWYDYLDLEQKATELYNTMKNTNWDTLTEQAKMYMHEKLQYDRNRVIMWDPERIEFQGEMYIPVEIRDLQSMPRPNIQRHIARARNWVRNYMPDDDFQIYDTLYKYKPSADPYNWVPPFKAHASIAGSQHYMTFDKHFYEFSGECSYVLARDFIDGNFTVVVNYDNVGGSMKKKSLTVMVDDKQVEIFPNFKVLVDGRRSETPIEFGNTVVRREGNQIRVDSQNGVTVTCNLVYDRCRVNVTGWYYGKTGGLFGTYDNEPTNDFTKADNMKATSPEEFASTWSVGRRCSVRNYAVQGPESVDRMRICGKYFQEESSPFRMCFKQIPNAPFMQRCLNDLPTNVNRMATEEDICETASSYVDECEQVGVPIRMPTVCVKCMTEDGRTYREGDNMTLSGSEVPKSGDVVFVVSQRACNRDVIDSLAKVVAQVDKAMRAEGLKNNRYSLVGYAAGGWFNMPHTHTMQNEIFNDPLKFEQALANFKIVEASDMEDPLNGIEFAAKLPFRTGVSKTIVLIPCDMCKEMASSYLDIQQLLLNRDIRLHILRHEDFELKKNTPTSSYIFGADKDGVYTNKHVGDSDLMGDRDLRKQVLMPKDLCVALTQESDGSVFNALKLNGRPAAQKKFVDVMTRLIAKKAEPTECQKCDCNVDPTGVGMAVCRSCRNRNAFYDLFQGFDNADYLESDSSSEEDSSLNERQKQYRPKKPKKSYNKKKPRRN